MDTGYRKRGGQRQPIVHDGAREDLRGSGSEAFQEPFELPIRSLPVAQLKPVHSEPPQLAEMVRRETAESGDRAAHGAVRRSEAE